jgi:hypothetical protein
MFRFREGTQTVPPQIKMPHVKPLGKSLAWYFIYLRLVKKESVVSTATTIKGAILYTDLRIIPGENIIKPRYIT